MRCRSIVSGQKACKHLAKKSIDLYVIASCAEWTPKLATNSSTSIEFQKLEVIACSGRIEGRGTYWHGATLAHKERLTAPLAGQGALGHLEQLALWVSLPPVPDALHSHGHAVAAAQRCKSRLHMLP